MSDTAYVGQRVENIEVSPQFQPYSRVIIHIDNDTEVIAGNTTGRTLELDNPFGNQKMANAILQSLSGFQYQPYTADSALLDPAAEIGDAIETPTVHGGIYYRNRTFGKLMPADVSAPTDEEINHEYVFETPTEREYKRQVADVKASFILTNNLIQTEVARASAAEGQLSSRVTQNAESITAEVTRATTAEGTLSATLSVHATEIAAKVNASGGGGSFSWVLNSNSHTWKSNNTEVMKVSASGLWIKGTVEAASGKIGGFDIGASALSYNGLNWGDTTKNYGVYVGQSGIQLGKNFSVNNSGNVTAKNLALQGGSISIGDNFSVNNSGNVTAKNLALQGGSISIGDNFSVSASGYLTARHGSFGSLSVDSGGNSSYSGSLSGCGGYVSSGLSYGGGSYGSLGSLDGGLSNVVTRVGNLEAISITTNNLVARIANAGTISVSNLILNGNYVYLRTEGWYDQEGNWHRIYYWGI